MEGTFEERSAGFKKKFEELAKEYNVILMPIIQIRDVPEAPVNEVSKDERVKEETADIKTETKK